MFVFKEFSNNFHMKFLIYFTALFFALPPSVNAQSSNLKSSSGNSRIAVLDASLYNADLSSFEKPIDLAKRFSDMANQFAKFNNIDFVLTSNVTYSKQDYRIIRNELLENTKIDSTRYLNPRIFFINGREFLEKSGLQKIDPLAQEKFTSFAKKIDADIIVNKVVFVADSLHITSDFVKYYKDGSLPSLTANNSDLSTCSLNVPNLLASSAALKILENVSPDNRTVIYKKIEKIIANYSNTNGIGIVFDSNFPFPSCDLTASIIKNIESL